MTEKISTIKSYLKTQSRNELIKEITVLYKSFPSVQEYFQVMIGDVDNGEEALLQKYKKIIRNEFMPERGLGKARLAVARKAIADFRKIAQSKNNIAEILVQYVEIGVEFTNTYGDINEPFYNSMEGMYDMASVYIKTHNLTDRFIKRLRKMVQATDGIGWGFHDDLEEMFHHYFGTYAS